MNKTAIKNYAIWARVQLIEAAKQRAFEYAITDGENDPNLEIINGKILSSEEKNQRAELISLIKQKGYEQVMEEAAYTWFNRFIALRFMEVNGYLPTKVRVFTDENSEFKPQILKEAMTVELEGIDREKILGLIEKQDNEELFKYLIIAQCNALSSGLPGMFETISNWTELLFPANLLKADSVIGQMITTIPEEDWTDQVQIIGWMYQYYNTELFDEIYDGDMSKRQIRSDQIPAATQLFTPDWVVQYMVENSLGRLWYEGHKDFDKSQWKYYIDDVEQKPEVETELAKIREEYSKKKPEEIKVIDPCMGSGHILVYAFDVLMRIYTSAGWSEREAARSIIENNLYGLDIDDRAGQLAYFAVMMKARKHNRRILNGEVRPNILSIQSANFMTDDFISFLAEEDASLKADLILLRETFANAKELGSILIVPSINLNAIEDKIEIIKNSYVEDLFHVQYKTLVMEQLVPIVVQAHIMTTTFDIVITNPPYLNNSRFDSKLTQYVNDNYPDEKADMAMIMLKKMLFGLLKENGYMSAITTISWMYLKSFEKFRQSVLVNKDFVNLIDFGTELFEGKIGHLPITAWVNRNSNLNPVFNAVRLVEFCYARRDEKEREFFNPHNKFLTHQSSLKKIPSSPIAYWVSDNFANNYAQKTIGDYAEVITGMTIGDNNKYLRLWCEVSINRIAFGKTRMLDVDLSKTNWIPYSKGGPRRNWYGNYDYVVNWSQKSSFNRSKTTLQHLYLKEAVTWPFISLGNFSARLLPTGSLWDVAGSPCFFNDQRTEYYTLGLMASCVANYIINAVNPTVNVQAADIARIPLLFRDEKNTNQVVDLVSKCIELSKSDWDSFENSYDFNNHPLI